MPFKRAGWLQRYERLPECIAAEFQCPLSGLVGCNVAGASGHVEPSFNAL